MKSHNGPELVAEYMDLCDWDGEYCDWDCGYEEYGYGSRDYIVQYKLHGIQDIDQL